MSSTVDEGKARNDAIELELKRDGISRRTEIKMLLLGAGESGKSTIIKQMKLIHEGGYSRDERLAFRAVIYTNTIQSMKVIIEAMDVLQISLANPDKNLQYARLLYDIPSQLDGDENLPPEVGAAIASLWTDDGVLATFHRSREYQLNDSAPYYFEAILRLADPNYVPTDQDVLRSRVKSTGITETRFNVGDLTYRMVDVGGQRSERKKWIYCFESVTTILFLVAISEYDQMLFEDETVNRMAEALILFDSICNSRWFIRTSIILFLNKTDIFRKKIMYSSISDYFPDFRGDEKSYEETSTFIRNRFETLNRVDMKHIYTHFTCATDTTQIKFVMAAVNDFIIQENLRISGMI
ncbi:guanine nucleotide binding protein, alpha subunit [Lipomyces oligophaga]|uniref:guanine nucleotide binding protein, alpha subunit n=1 Tax=Lipomyces oligophaga TaxID=45792 RepID=UPI0034CEE508